VELIHEFTVPASVDDAWAAFNDLERIAPCFPGAALTSYDGESFEGVVKVKLGPISLQYTGTGRFAERDEGAHRAVVEAKGKDKRGNGTAAARITATLASVGDAATAVTVKTDLNITGRPAQFGRGVMQDVSDRLLGQFASCLETKLGESSADPAASAPEAPAPADGPEAPASADAPDVRETPAAVKHRAAVEPDSPAPAPSAAPPGPEAEPLSALDLGAAVVPALVKRYAVHIVAAAVAVWLLRKVLRRGSRG
jgi:carbon monoxide dehydrogenase subunit G